MGAFEGAYLNSLQSTVYVEGVVLLLRSQKIFGDFVDQLSLSKPVLHDQVIFY